MEPSGLSDGEKSTRTIAVDLDGVLFPWLDLIRSHFQSLGYECPPDTGWEVWEYWGIPKGLFHREWERLITDERLYRQGDPIDMSRDCLWRLSDAGWQIEIVTHRLQHPGHHAEVIFQTTDWLDQHHVPYHGISFTGNKTIYCDVIVDDNPDYLDASAADLKLLYAAEHNVHLKDEPEYVYVEDWWSVEWELIDRYGNN